MLAELTGGRSRTRSAREGFGKPVPRRKDTRPLVGAGCYSEDVNLPGRSHSASCAPHMSLRSSVASIPPRRSPRRS